jgi:hypothetical protein
MAIFGPIWMFFVVKMAIFGQFGLKISELFRKNFTSFSQVETSLEKARKTRSNPNFRKTVITETRENENFWQKPSFEGPYIFGREH